MSREIKFRAWVTLSDYDNDGNDKDFHGMVTRLSVHQDGAIGFHVEEGNRVFGADVFDRAIENGTAYEYEEWCYWEGKLDLMQYTGLKDKTGVEIAEGDLVRHHTGSVGVVEWGKYVTANDDNEDILGWMVRLPLRARALDPQGTWDVIGNIHETPELLEATS